MSTSRLDRRFAEIRAEAMRTPLTRAGGPVLPSIDLPGGIHIALSVNK